MLFATPALKKQRVPNRKKPSEKRSRYMETTPEYSTRNGYAIYAYKGVVIEKRMNVYYIAKRIQIKGFPEEVIKKMEGTFTAAYILKDLIDFGLESVDAKRHAEVREKLKNWKCPHCETITLLDAKHKHVVWKYVKNEWGEEDRIDTGRRRLKCHYCMEETLMEEVEYVSDETVF
ncbi:TPA: hypothetical protein ACQ3CK_000576 [Klebsiella pneumoniae]|uniref:hypothetical protein n=1 Tax=Klebsiella pneumoniae TaxID=573 RepID=UPI0004953B01|nr:hypothetical protein [Klebsiella pneumoniae]EKW9150266.1 hypothetical protein [Klebsiella pneumoniae]SSH94350.1 Uncharacterised protein [Klebsiella pneumoniae]SSL86939.1 Uncharacterised protein [Klebsiella pneumoniae]HBQ9394339.1 hypothetical protein [Klebsiella pneumoniae]HBR7556224.1 hypothetical protein [Klebsiella pneumoniae]